MANINEGLKAGSGPAEDPGRQARRSDESASGPLAREATPPARSAPLPKVAGYELVGELGRGSMGVVYKAREVDLNRLVALKMIVAGANATAEQLARFETEARSVAAIQHPNIVHIHQLGHADGLPYLSLEFIEGQSLDQIINSKPQPPKRAVRLIETLSRAIAVAHQHGIVHRDLKPANVLVTADGTPKITDFGLAKELESPSSQTRSSAQLGTPSYMAPEQAMGEPFGPLVDVYALGAILYEMLVGRPPFLGASTYETTMLVVNEEPVRPSLLVSPMPVDVETICLKCLHKEPSRRYADAEALAEDCRRFLAGEPILSRPVSAAERTWRWCRRNPRTAGLAATVVGLLALVAAGSSVAAVSISHARNEAVVAKNEAVRNSTLADQARRVAEESTRLADARANDALTSIQTLVDKVQTQLEDVPGVEPLKKELLDIGLEDLRRLAAQWKKSRSTETTELAAHMRLGDTFRKIGTTAEAMQEYLYCHSIAWRRARDFPNNAASQGNLATVLSTIGGMRQELEHDMKASLDCYKQAVEIWEKLDKSPPSTEGPVAPETIKKNLAESLVQLGVSQLRAGRPEEAAALLRRTVDIRRGMLESDPDNRSLRLDLARSYQGMGAVTFALDDADQSREFWDLSLAANEQLAAADADDLGSQLELANVLGNRAENRYRSGDLDAARDFLARALTIDREILALDEENVELTRIVAGDCHRFGVIEAMAGNTEQSIRWFEESLVLRERIAAMDRNHLDRQIELMLTLARLGKCARVGEIADAILTPNADPDLLINIARCKAQCAKHLRASDAATADTHSSEAIAAIRRAIEADYRDRIMLTTDPDLEPLKSHPDFDLLMKSIAAH